MSFLLYFFFSSSEFLGHSLLIKRVLYILIKARNATPAVLTAHISLVHRQARGKYNPDATTKLAKTIFLLRFIAGWTARTNSTLRLGFGLEECTDAFSETERVTGIERTGWSLVKGNMRARWRPRGDGMRRQQVEPNDSACPFDV